MSSTHYCPLCSVFLPDPNLSRCPKCGVDIEVESQRKTSYEAKIKRKSQLVEGPFHPVTGRRCPICNEDVEIQSPRVEEFQVKGEVLGKGPMGDEHAAFRAIVGYQPWRCRKGHNLFSGYEVVWREICPRCHEPLHRYGDLVYSCSKCHLMVPKGLFRKDDPIALMEKRGFKYCPDLEDNEKHPI